VIATELIRRLQDLISEHGDLPVLVELNHTAQSVEYVEPDTDQDRYQTGFSISLDPLGAEENSHLESKAKPDPASA
jgi:hypothetical protein